MAQITVITLEDGEELAADARVSIRRAVHTGKDILIDGSGEVSLELVLSEAEARALMEQLQAAVDASPGSSRGA